MLPGSLTPIYLQDTFASSHTTELLPVCTLIHRSQHSLRGVNCFQDVPLIGKGAAPGKGDSYSSLLPSATEQRVWDK